NEPVCDAVRSILDGHIILSRRLAAAGHYPAIDIMNSVSRLNSQICGHDHRQAASKIREALATYEESKDLIELGAYVAGTNPRLDAACRAHPHIVDFLRQDSNVQAPAAESISKMHALAAQL